MVKFLIFALIYVIFGWAIARSKILADIMLNKYGDDTSSFHVLEWIVFILEGGRDEGSRQLLISVLANGLA